MLCIGEYLNVSIHLCTGGTNIAEDKRILREGVHVVVGTPGRVLDMLKKEFLRIDYLKLFILDEADEMLGRGFHEQIKDVFKLLPPEI